MTTEEEIIKERDKALLSLDIEEAIKTLEVAIAEVEWDYPMEYAVAFDMAIAALRAQQETENPMPLTLDELREMNGEPVWVSASENWRKSGVYEGWCLVRLHTDDNKIRVYLYDTRFGASYFAQQDYGISWLAYRHKPKEDLPCS